MPIVRESPFPKLMITQIEGPLWKEYSTVRSDWLLWIDVKRPIHNMLIKICTRKRGTRQPRDDISREGF